MYSLAIGVLVHMRKSSMDSMSIIANIKVEQCSKDINLGLTKREAKPSRNL